MTDNNDTKFLRLLNKIKKGDVESVLKIVKESEELLKMTGNASYNELSICFALIEEKYDLALDLTKAYPDLLSMSCRRYNNVLEYLLKEKKYEFFTKFVDIDFKAVNSNILRKIVTIHSDNLDPYHFAKINAEDVDIAVLRSVIYTRNEDLFYKFWDLNSSNVLKDENVSNLVKAAVSYDMYNIADYVLDAIENTSVDHMTDL
jgi:hypothetical protein